MTANFYAFEQERRLNKREETDIKRNLAEEKADVVKKMECRIRHMIVRYFAPEWRVKSLFRKSRFSAKGSNLVFLHSLFTHHKTTVISRFLFWKMPQGKW